MKKNILLAAFIFFAIKISLASTVFVSKTFGYNDIDVTLNIQNAFDSQYDTIVIDFTGKDWIVKPLFAKSNKVVIFQSGVVILAKQGEFKNVKDVLITITNASNISLLGYGATLRMRKADYQNAVLYSPSEWRHAVNIQAYLNQPVENIVVKGFHIETSGGDGICIAGISGYPSSEPIQPKNVLIQDVVCEDNHRQGISLTGGIDVKIINTILKDTKGTPPQAGIDFEPDWERMLNVTMTNCYFSNNRVNGIEFYLYRPAWKGPKTIGLTFDNCHVDSDEGIQGIALGLHNLQDIDGSDGLITFNDCSFRNRTIYNNINIDDKSALKAKVILNRCFIEQTNSAGSVISFSTTDANIKNVITYGGLEFNNCVVNDRYDRNFMSFADNGGTGRGIRDVQATLTVNNPFGAKYTLGAATQNVNIQITENKSNPPTVSISQPAKYQKIQKGTNLTVTSTASDSDVGSTNGAGILKVIYEIQYADTKVHTTEDTQAPFTFTVATTGWQKGIYLVKAIAVSSNLGTRNISVNPFEITSSELITAKEMPEGNAAVIKLSPNPAQNKLFINGNHLENALYEITSVEGKSIQTGAVDHQAISIENLKTGIYLIKIKTDAGNCIERFVKE